MRKAMGKRGRAIGDARTWGWRGGDAPSCSSCSSRPSCPGDAPAAPERLGRPSVSAIVALRNEVSELAELLPQLKRLSAEAEVIIVDGLSDDGTFEVLSGLTDSGEVWYTLLRTGRSRGEAFNAGARAAQGQVLLFLHADTRLPDDAIDQVGRVAQRCGAGCFKIRFDDSGAFMRWNGAASNLRVLARGIAFGDQGMFMDRQLFWDVGGFPDIPIMEDYELSLRLRARGVRLGMTRASLVTSSRRYANGPRSKLACALHMIALRARYRAGEPPERLAAEYGEVR